MRARWFALAVTVLALALAVFVSPHASSRPDGLERVALDHGFARQAVDRGPPAVGPLAGTLAVLASGGFASIVLLRRRGAA